MLDKLTVEVIKNAAIYASEEMGIVLRNTAYSPNIKDRLDHTCAIYTPRGELVAQAEHIPVHIGSMAVGVRNALRYLEENSIYLEPGDIVMVNDPFIAGTHLNDIMLIKPVYYNGKLVALVSNKAHHVDVGGMTPGSIGGGARELLQEGIVIPPIKVVERGVLQRDIIELIKSNVRTPEYFEGDLNAQIASLNVGERRVIELAERYGHEKLLEAWGEILDYTERYTRARISGLKITGRWSAKDYIELDSQDAVIRVTLNIASDYIRVDYSGTSPQVDEPVNAVYGVTVAATIYALKAVIDPDLPVNHGFFRAVEIYAPPGSLVNPHRGAPVSGGNTETSQRIVDVVFRALAGALPERVPAASCGSMTNVMIGGYSNGRRWAFYETVACGQGARPGLDGVDGVHTNMTNTLNTPIERLEAEYPILFVKYEFRPDSEGPGKYRGGLGVTRAFMLVEGKATLTIVAERCRHRPWGLMGGGEAAPASHYVVRRSGKVVELGCKNSIVLSAGDIVYINTPGGGGYGDPCLRDGTMVLRDIEEDKISLDRAIPIYCYGIKSRL
ncbi:MAG: hydantoinase B/oxoprolinase family protein [Desulfurococcales archaeon]|nr:hydantoinase B/oxoprolinase family protein [Desulfurococcales archaeon]